MTTTEWAVRYFKTNPDGTTRVQFTRATNERAARRAVQHRIPSTGHHHTVVKREVTPWEEA